MKIYHYDPDTKEYLKEGTADANPRNPEKPLVPAHATAIRPPDPIEGYVLRFLVDEWVQVELLKPAEGKQVEGQQEPTDEEEALMRLRAIDTKSVRAIREWIAGDDATRAKAYERLRQFEEEAKAERGRLIQVVVQEKG